MSVLDALLAPGFARSVRAVRKAREIDADACAWLPTLDTRSIKFSRLAEDGSWHEYVVRLSPDSAILTCQCPAYHRSGQEVFCKHVARAILDCRRLGLTTYPLPAQEVMDALREYALRLRQMLDEVEEYDPFKED